MRETDEVQTGVNKWQAALIKLYEGLTFNHVASHADLIFVIAGRMERKHYGLQLFNAGWAPKLLLSVGRFEVSKMSLLKMNGFEKLVTLRDRTPPQERHFFLTVDASGIRTWSRDVAR